jgi:hypothetical protein
MLPTGKNAAVFYAGPDGIEFVFDAVRYQGVIVMERGDLDIDG